MFIRVNKKSRKVFISPSINEIYDVLSLWNKF